VQVVVFTRQDCPLCDEAIAAAVSAFGGENVSLVDVDLDLELLDKYTNRIPVVETHDGVVVAEGVITESELREFSSRR